MKYSLLIIGILFSAIGMTIIISKSFYKRIYRYGIESKDDNRFFSKEFQHFDKRYLSSLKLTFAGIILIIIAIFFNF